MTPDSPDRALVVGEALIDIVQRDGRVVGEYVGGSPLNVAAGLGRLGRGIDFLTHLGDDARGRRITTYLETAGVQLVSDSVRADRTSTATAVLDADGAASYELDLDWQISGTPDIPPPLIAHTGSIASMRGPGALATAALLDTYRTDATITYDPNIRPALLTDREQAIARLERIVEKSDVVKASAEDLRWIDPARSAEQIAQAWQKLGPAIVVVTLGARGAFAVSAAGTVRVTAPPVPVVDTIGAGDAFMAGLIDALWSHALLGGGRRSALAAIDTATVDNVLRAATTVAAYVVQRTGADMPRRVDLPQR